MSRSPSDLTTLVAVGLAAGTISVAAPAAAQERTFRDARDTPASAIDVRRVTVDHGTARPRMLTIDVRLRSVIGGDEMSFYLDTDSTDAGPEYLLAGAASSEYYFDAVDNWRENGTTVDCAGDRMRLAIDTRRAFVRVPLRCVDNPGSVRVAIKAERSEATRSRDWAKAPRRWLGAVRRG